MRRPEEKAVAQTTASLKTLTKPITSLPLARDHGDLS